MLINKFEEYLDSLNLNIEKTNNLSFLRYKIGNITIYYYHGFGTIEIYKDNFLKYFIPNNLQDITIIYHINNLLKSLIRKQKLKKLL